MVKEQKKEGRIEESETEKERGAFEIKAKRAKKTKKKQILNKQTKKKAK